MKKSLAVMLALIMVLCMIPTTAFAADIIDQKNNVYIYKGEPTYYNFLREFSGGSITKQENEEVTWQRLPRYTNKCARCRRVLVEAIPDYYCINPDKNIKIKNQEVIGEYGVRVASWKGNDVYNGDPCFEFYCKAAKAGETDVTVTYYYNYNYRGATGYCNYCGNRVTVPAQTNWYEESVTFHVKCETQEPPTDNPPAKPDPRPSVTPTIDGLTGVEVVEVKCITKNSGHAEKSYQLIADSYEVGDVKGDAASGYTCDITVEPAKYVAQYNSDISGVTHTLVDSNQPGKIKLVWDKEAQKWKLANPSGVPVVFDVECKNTQPENPAELTYFTKSRVIAITDNMPKPPEGVTFNTNPTVTFDATNTTANLLYSFTVKGTPGAEVTITDTGAKFYNNNNGNWVENNITVTLPPIEGAADYATYTVYGYMQFTKDNIADGMLKNTATARVEGSEELVPGKATVPAEDKTGPEPSENPNPSPSTEPSPTPTPTPGGGNGEEENPLG